MNKGTFLIYIVHVHLSHLLSVKLQSRAQIIVNSDSYYHHMPIVICVQ